MGDDETLGRGESIGLGMAPLAANTPGVLVVSGI